VTVREALQLGGWHFLDTPCCVAKGTWLVRGRTIGLEEVGDPAQGADRFHASILPRNGCRTYGNIAGMASRGAHGPDEQLVVDGRTVTITSPEKVFFAARGETKLDLARYYLDAGLAALRGVFERPTVLKRYPDGAEGKFFFQKRVPTNRPPWLETVTVEFPSGRSAEELCPTDSAHIAWAVNLGCIDLNPWPVRRSDLEHPDELRVDLDPQPGVVFGDVRRTAMVVRELLAEYGLEGFPKTSGSRGIHIIVPVVPEHDFTAVRRAALALARAAERRLPALVTAAWWKEERGTKVFFDYNQNARDRTVASVYSVRANPEGRVSCALEWDEVPDVEPQDLTIATVPQRLKERGDPFSVLDDHRYRIDSLLELAARDEAEGLGDAPWPPHFAKQSGEPHRAPPSRTRRKDG